MRPSARKCGESGEAHDLKARSANAAVQLAKVVE